MEENTSIYRNAVSTIKQVILQSQYRAAKLVTGYVTDEESFKVDIKEIITFEY